MLAFAYMIYYLIAVILIVLSPTQVHSAVRHSKVLILGAGASGIAAAKQLQANNIHDFVIIDALPFVGGKTVNIVVKYRLVQYD